jgi:hypothetical protein
VTVYVVDDRVEAVRTSAVVTCPANTYVDWINRPTNDDLSSVDTCDKHYDDGRGGHGTSTIRAHVDGHALNGTVRMVQRIGADTCDSGVVRFAAQR